MGWKKDDIGCKLRMGAIYERRGYVKGGGRPKVTIQGTMGVFMDPKGIHLNVDEATRLGIS